MKNKLTNFVCLKKKVLIIALSLVLAMSMLFGILFANNKTVVATSDTQSVSDTARLTSETGLVSNPADYKAIANNFYTTRTLQKDSTGTGADQVEYSGLVPYGVGEISLGTYDFSQNANLNSPLFEILPQNAWSSSNVSKDTDLTSKYFKVYLTSGSKKVTYYFTRATRTDAAQYAVFLADTNNTALNARKMNNVELNGVDYPLTIIPYAYDGTYVGSSVKGEDNATAYSKPEPIGFYYDAGKYYMDCYYQTAKTNVSGVVKETSDSSGVYRYTMKYDHTYVFTADELKNVKISVEFDTAPTTQEDSWIMFTSIAGKKVLADYTSYEYLDSKGDYFEITSSNNTVDLNKTVNLSDNTALTKLIEFETTPVNSASAEISDVVIKFTNSDNSNSIMFNYTKADQGDVRIRTGFNLSDSEVKWYTYKRGANTTVDNTSSKSLGYYFDGAIKHSSNYDEDLVQLVSGNYTTPRFALYYDKSTNIFYTDNGRNTDVGDKYQFDGKYRWTLMDMNHLVYNYTTSFSSLAKWDEFVSGNLNVSIEVTLADDVDKTAIKLTNIDGQSLERETVTSSTYKVVNHDYAIDKTVDTTKLKVGDTFTLPELKDNGLLAGGTTVSDYVVKLNGEVVEGETVELAVNNKIEYFVNEQVVASFEFSPIDIIHRGAAIRYDETDTSLSGIRYIVAIRQDDYDALGSASITTGMLTVGTINLDSDTVLDKDTVSTETKPIINTTFEKDELALIELDGVEYYQMVICVMDIPSTDYAKEVTTKGYIAVDGVYLYSAQVSRSISVVAQAYKDANYGTPGYNSGIENFIVAQ